MTTNGAAQDSDDTEPSYSKNKPNYGELNGQIVTRNCKRVSVALVASRFCQSDVLEETNN